MEIILPVALIKINIFLIPLAGFFIGLVAGMFGVGGGIIAVPTMIALGVSPFVTTATSISQTIGTTFSGALTQYSNGNLNLKVALSLICGGIVGGLSGVLLISSLGSIDNFNQIFDYVFYSFLLFVSIRLILSNRKKDNSVKESKVRNLLKSLPFQISDEKSNDSVTFFALFLLGVLAGLLAELTGLGGGILVVPVLSYFFPNNFNLAVAASFVYMVVLNTILTFMNIVNTQNVDVILCSLLLIGSVIGVQFGVKIGNKLGARLQKLLFGFFIILVFAKKILSKFGYLQFESENSIQEVLVPNTLSDTLATWASEQQIFYFFIVIGLSLVLGFGGKYIFSKK
ncbi:MAG: sulfite exporter TauE/SafE family protein [Calditrichaeota bacterium]|nr:MAG: sulfite exporter TauE/SafE family protein [Calditrichota bacterium]